MELLCLYIDHYPNKVQNYAEQLQKDPDLARIPLELCSKIWNAIGVGLMIGGNLSFYDSKAPFKRALAMTSDTLVIAAILQNLAVLNYLEIKYHNNRITEEEDDKVGQGMLEMKEHFDQQNERDPSVPHFDDKTNSANFKVPDSANEEGLQKVHEEIAKLKEDYLPKGKHPDDLRFRIIARQEEKKMLNYTEVGYF